MDVQDVQVQESIDDIADLISGMKIQAENDDEVDRDTTPTPQVEEDVEAKENILESPDKHVENILESENIHESENSVKIDEIRVNKDSEDSEKIAEIEKSGESENCQKSEEPEKIHEIESSVKIEELENEEIQESENTEIIREIGETEKIVKTEVAIEEEKFVKIEEPEIVPEIETFESQNDTFEIPIATKPTDLKPSEPFENLVNISVEQTKIEEEKNLLDTSEIENPPQAQPVEEFRSLEKLGKILTPVQKLKNAEKINGTPTDIEKIKMEKPTTPVKNEENGEQVIFNYIS